MITHKFREVAEHADDVSVLRKGALVASHAVAEVSSEQLANAMVGEGKGVITPLFQRDARDAGEARLVVQGLQVMGDRGQLAVQGLSVSVRAGEIVGVAGVSGNGQRELMESLVGQRAIESGQVSRGRRALSRHPRAEPPAEGAQPARRALAQCLRGRDERGPQHGPAGVRHPAGGAQRLAALERGAASARAS